MKCLQAGAGFRDLSGVDYSAEAVALARAVTEGRGVGAALEVGRGFKGRNSSLWDFRFLNIFAFYRLDEEF